MNYQIGDTVQLCKDYYPKQGGKIPKGTKGQVQKLLEEFGQYIVDFGGSKPVILSDVDLV